MDPKKNTRARDPTLICEETIQNAGSMNEIDEKFQNITVSHELDQIINDRPKKFKPTEKPEYMITIYKSALEFEMPLLQKNCIEHMLKYPHMSYLDFDQEYEVGKRIEFLNALLDNDKIENPSTELLQEMVFICDNTTKVLKLFNKFELDMPESIYRSSKITCLTDVLYALNYIHEKPESMKSLVINQSCYQSDVEEIVPPGSPLKKRRNN